jgi:hypothetical protein
MQTDGEVWNRIDRFFDYTSNTLISQGLIPCILTVCLHWCLYDFINTSRASLRTCGTEPMLLLVKIRNRLAAGRDGIVRVGAALISEQIKQCVSASC